MRRMGSVKKVPGGPLVHSVGSFSPASEPPILDLSPNTRASSVKMGKICFEETPFVSGTEISLSPAKTTAYMTIARAKRRQASTLSDFLLDLFLVVCYHKAVEAVLVPRWLNCVVCMHTTGVAFLWTQEGMNCGQTYLYRHFLVLPLVSLGIMLRKF